MSQELYTAISGMVAGMWQQAQIGHNLANASTVGYKRHRVSLSDFAGLIAAIQNSQSLPEPGVGVRIFSEQTDFGQGPLQLTRRQLDLALAGPAFLRVMTPGGERLSRAGQLHRDQTGRLLNSEGHAVLGPNGPIEAPPGDLTITEEGDILVEGELIDRLALAELDDPGTSLERVGGTLFALRDGAEYVEATQTRVQQGYLEGANVDLTLEMTNLVAVARMYQMCQRLALAEDDIAKQTANELGRV